MASEDDKLLTAERQLDRIHAMFARVDGKSSFLLGTDVGLLALMFYNVGLEDLKTWYTCVPFFFALFIIACAVYELYRAAFPQLKGGQGSLVYFKTIQDRTEAAFIAEWTDCSPGAYLNDVLGQIWRNSQILNDKFKYVRNAFYLTILSLIPWTIFLFASGLLHSRMLVVK